MTSSAPPTETRAEARARLRDLLCSLFSGGTGAIRSFVRFDPTLLSLEDSIAWDRDLRAVVEQILERCEARGLISEGLFHGLMRERPARTPEIAQVAALWGITLSSLAAERLPQRHRRTVALWLVTGVALAAAGALVMPTWFTETSTPAGASRSDERIAHEAPHTKVAPVTPANGPIEQPPLPASPQAPPPPADPPQPASPSRPATTTSQGSQACQRQVIDRLKRAGNDGGSLRDCWTAFWAQTATRAASCPIVVSRTSDAPATLTLVEPRDRMAATECLETRSVAVLKPLQACPGEFSYELTLAKIAPAK